MTPTTHRAYNDFGRIVGLAGPLGLTASEVAALSGYRVSRTALIGALVWPSC